MLIEANKSATPSPRYGMIGLDPDFQGWLSLPLFYSSTYYLTPVHLTSMSGSEKSFTEVLSRTSVASLEKVTFDAEEERQAVRRLDYQIVPLMTVFYLLSFLVCSSPLLLLSLSIQSEFRIVQI